MNSGVSSYMWMKPCSSRSTSLGMWREVRVSPCRKMGISALRIRISLDEGTQVGDGLLGGFRRRELLVVDGQDEGRAAALLLGEGRHVTVAGHAQDLQAFLLDGFRQGADAQGQRCFSER